MNQSNSSNSDKKKFVYIIVITIITFVLMFYFKYSNQFTDTIVQGFKDGLEDGKRLTSFLKSLDSRTEISNEDAFNFAMYKNLPIDKENNKILTLGDSRSGDDFFEIKKADYKGNTNNYKKFLKKIRADEEHRREIDSILQFYKPQLYSAILIKENDKVAVGLKLIHINEAMRADLLKYSAPRLQVDDRIALLEKTKVLPKIKKKIKNLEHDYIFIDKDTSFNFQIEPQPEALRIKEIAEVERSIEEPEAVAVSESFTEDNIKVNLELGEEGFKVKIDSLQKNLFKLNISDEEFKVYIPDIDKHIIDIAEIEDLEDSIEDINDVFEDFILRIENKDDKTGNAFSFKIGKDGDTGGVSFEMNINNINKLVGNSLQMFNKYNEEDWEQFGLRMDSLAKVYEKQIQDSIKFDVEKFKKEIKKKKSKKEK